jgi:hypothetical protein
MFSHTANEERGGFGGVGERSVQLKGNIFVKLKTYRKPFGCKEKSGAENRFHPQDRWEKIGGKDVHRVVQEK